MTRALAVALLAAVAAPAAGAYIEAIYPLQNVINESEVIALGEIEKVDPKNKTAVMKVTKTLKGKCDYDRVRMNIGCGQDWHPDAIMKHFAVGAPALIFYNGERRAEAYVSRFFFQLYGDAGAPPDKAWWNFTHIEVRMNRTFNGTVSELDQLVSDVLTGKRKAPSPDPRLPIITRNDAKALPAHGEPAVDEASLPPPFAKRDPARKPKPREAESPAGAVRGGLAYEYYEGAWTELPDFDALKPAAAGVAETIDLSKCARQEQVGLRFRGWIEVPRDGDYIFTTVSDDGSKLFIGRTEVVSNDGLHAPQEVAGEIPLKAGKHSITLLFFENSGGKQLDVFWEGPDLPKQPIPSSALFRAAQP